MLFGSVTAEAMVDEDATATMVRPGDELSNVGELGGAQHREKRIQHDPDIEELARALNALSLERDYWVQTAHRVQSSDPVERYEGTKHFRMMLSGSGEIPIQDVIDTGVVPCLVECIAPGVDLALQFEAAWALTNIASGTCQQTEVVVRAGAVPRFLMLIDNPREDIREQGMWGLGNIAGDRPEFRDTILNHCDDVVARFVTACQKSKRTSTVRTGVWSLSNLCRGKPRPEFAQVAASIPYLAAVLAGTTDSDTLSDACWALDGLSEHAAGIAAILAHDAIPLLIRFLGHPEVAVQRPALRVIGQVAAGDADQTQEILNHGALPALKALLASPRKGIRKDACWTLSNVAAGNAQQLQELLNEGLITALVELFHTDSELDVRKEAAWAICNACTSHLDEQLHYLVTQNCLRALCEMLTIEDAKILEVALEAMENLLQLGERMATGHHSINGDHGFVSSSGPPGIATNVCAELIRASEGALYLQQFHRDAQSFGNFKLWQKINDLLQRWFSDQAGGGSATAGEKKASRFGSSSLHVNPQYITDVNCMQCF